VVAFMDGGFVPLKETQLFELEDQLHVLEKRSEELAAEVTRLKGAVPSARVGRVGGGRAGPTQAKGTPSVPPPPDIGHPTPSPAPCLLSEGDLGEVRLEEAELVGEAGTRAVVATASAWRMEPAPETRLFGGVVRWDLAAALPPAKASTSPTAPEKERWGAGLWSSLGSRGWLLGPAVGLPAVRLGPLQLEVLIGLGGGPSGTWASSTTGIARWR
jgi:hypothetical protein